ncbi:Toxin RelK [termite gut metagenome]|uniref:Putative mRNA interferase YoeB n=1 Tax=termite gut metagenome TaxID=433724 RepID=A0A5J4R7U1_9ZZZZ
MEKYIIITSDEAKKHLALHYKFGNKVVIKRIERIFEELEEHPEIGIGQPERLKHNLSDKWSRRIDEKNRIIYQIDKETVTVTVISAKGHYSDK